MFSKTFAHGNNMNEIRHKETEEDRKRRKENMKWSKVRYAGFTKAAYLTPMLRMRISSLY